MDRLNKKVVELSDELVNAVQTAIKVESVEDEAACGMPYGKGVADVLEYVLKLADKMGFKTFNLDGHVGYAEYGESDDYIAVLGHLDVVPVGSGWTYPPFGGEIHNGRIYGRGAVDDKGPIIAALYALEAIKDLGYKLSKKVRIIFGTNEETGCKDMEYYLKKEHPPIYGFTPDGAFPVIFAEKGSMRFNIVRTLNIQDYSPIRVNNIRGGERINIVPNYCEAKVQCSSPQEIILYCNNFAKQNNHCIEVFEQEGNVYIKTYGVSAHASRPNLGKNAVMIMLALLGDLRLGFDLNEYITHINNCIGMETNGKSLGIACEDEESGGLTLNVGIIEMTEEKISISCDVRFPVTYNGEYLMNLLQSKIETVDLILENARYGKPLYYPKDHMLIKTLTDVFNAQTGLDAVPIAIGGGTYAKHMPNTVAVGPQFPNKHDLCHQADEYIEINDLILSARIYAHAIYNLAK